MGHKEALKYMRDLIGARDYIRTHRFEVIVLGKETTPDDPLMVEHGSDYEKHKQENAAIKILLAERIKGNYED